MIVRLVGSTFAPDYPHGLRLVWKALRKTNANVPVELHREPDNEHDPNAVGVRYEGSHLGYVPRGIANIIARQFDAGRPWTGAVMEIPVDTRYPDRPGCVLRIWPADQDPPTDEPTPRARPLWDDNPYG